MSQLSNKTLNSVTDTQQKPPSPQSSLLLEPPHTPEEAGVNEEVSQTQKSYDQSYQEESELDQMDNFQQSLLELTKKQLQNEVYAGKISNKVQLQTDIISNAAENIKFIQNDLKGLKESMREYEIKTSSFESRFGSDTRRMQQTIDESCEAVFSRAEKIIFDSYNVTRKELKEQHHYVEAQVLQVTNQIKSVQYLGDKIKELEELYKLKMPGQTIVEALIQKLENPIYNLNMPKLRKQFFTQHQVEDQISDIKDEINVWKSKHEEHVDQVQKLFKEMHTKHNTFLLKETFYKEKTTFATTIDLGILRQEFESLPKLDSVLEMLIVERERINDIQNLIKTKFVEKTDLVKYDVQIKKYCTETYCTTETYKKNVEPVIKQISQFQKIERSLSSLQEQCQKFEENLGSKCSIAEFDTVKDQLQRFALYEDYKQLYKKVIPPMAQYEILAKEHIQEITAFREIIRQIDENLQQRALKTELVPIVNMFRQYAKENKFSEFVKDVKDHLRDSEQSIEELAIQTERQFTDTKDLLQKSLQVSEIKLKTHIKEQISILTKDNQPSISRILGGSGQNQVQQIREEIVELVKHKANADDVIKLQEGKTNKADTVSHMECLETMHRMLLHVNGLLVEQAKLGVNNKSESIAQRNERQHFIIEQALNIQRWIEEYRQRPKLTTQQDIMRKSLQTAMPIMESPRIQNSSPNRIEGRKLRLKLDKHISKILYQPSQEEFNLNEDLKSTVYSMRSSIKPLYPMVSQSIANETPISPRIITRHNLNYLSQDFGKPSTADHQQI